MTTTLESFVFPAFSNPAYPAYNLPPPSARRPARLTALRLGNDLKLGAYIKVEADDGLDGQAHEDGAPTGRNTLATRFLRLSEEITITVEVQMQGLVTIAMPDWFPDCCIPFMLSLGTFCPLDATDTSGVNPANRRLYWGAAGPNTRPPAKAMEFRFNGQGRLTCSHLNSEHTMYLRVAPSGGAPQLCTTHIVLATRDGESGVIRLPACDGQPAAELKL